ncbi:MAG: protein kinase [Planctomycetaceae bacterium]|nr:protein kinase [Planctomycetaceae bacterium]
MNGSEPTPAVPEPDRQPPAARDEESNSMSLDETVLKDRLTRGQNQQTERPQTTPKPAMTSSQDEPELTRLGRYDLTRVLGKGGFGVVYEGFDPTLRRKVAIKVPRVEELTPAIEEEFLTEARQLAQLSHPGIVTVFDIVTEPNRCFIVFDFVEGESLSTWMKRTPVDLGAGVQIFAQIADALAHAHAQRTIHRDLKPANVIINADGVPVIVDFGLSVSDSQRAVGTQLGEISGTPGYMSPEQASGAGHRIDGRTDIYSLGVMLYRLMTGRMPFQARDTAELLRQVRSDEPQPPRQLVRHLPPDLERICLRAMTKSLSRRYLTADDMALELRGVLASGVLAHPLNPPQVGPGVVAPPRMPTVNPTHSPPAETLSPRPAPPEMLPQEDLREQHEPTVIPGVTDMDDASAIVPPQTLASGDEESIRGAGSDQVSSSQSHIRQAQRRQVTVVNAGCDVFENEEILETLDPEEQSDVLRAFQDTCRRLANELQGSVLQETEDGISVCFGFPQVFENSAQRAMQFGLNVLHELSNISRLVEKKHSVKLSGRVVAHTEVAIAEAKAGPDDSTQGLSISIGGKVRTVVNRLDSVAELGQFVITDATSRIVRNQFEVESIGEHRIKGVPGKIALFQVVGSRADQDQSSHAELTPLIGRERELGLLLDRWEQAAEGMGQVVLLIGEAGLGKSRLLHDLKQRILSSDITEEVPRVMEWRASPQYQSTSLYAVLECLKRQTGIEADDAGQERLAKLEQYLHSLDLHGPTEVAILATRLSIPLNGAYPELDLPPQRQKELLFDFLLNWLQELSSRNPLLFVVEDLHWVDPTTLEFLELFVNEGSQDRVLSVMTFRPEFETPWRSKAHQTHLALNRLTRRQIREMMEAKARHSIAEWQIEQIIERTDGVPLFVEEFTQMLLETSDDDGDSMSSRSSASFHSHAIPATLQDMLMTRLDRMASNIEVVQLCAAIGREFTFELVKAASDLDESTLREELAKLVNAELLLTRGRGTRERFTFRHALLLDAAHNSMIKARRLQFHGRIAAAIETLIPETREQQPELLALHYTEAEDYTQAVACWEAAGMTSLGRRAFKESIQQLGMGIDLISHLPESPERVHREVKMLTALGVPLQATLGYSAPEVEHSYSRALELSATMPDPHERFPILYGMFRYYMLQARYAQANELARQLVDIAEETQVPHFRVAAHRAHGGPPVYEGRLADSIPHLSQVIEIPPTKQLRAEVYRYDVVDPWIASHSYLSWARWLQGDISQAMKHSGQAVEIAEGLDHSFSLSLALCFSQWIHQFRHDIAQTRATAESALALAQEHGFAFWFGWCRVMRGWAISQQGKSTEGIQEIETGIEQWKSTGSELGCQYYYTLLAEAALSAKQWERAETALNDATAFADNSGEGFWRAEVLRNRGELIIHRDPLAVAAAAALFQQAISSAQEQGACSLALRAAVSLGRVSKGTESAASTRQQLLDLLPHIQGGEQTVDYQHAQNLLNEL